MLHHHVQEEHAPYVAPRPLPEHAPATAQEVAQAIVSIEARRQDNAPARTQTVTLQDTTRQLELTVTPEELLAELHTQRTATHQKMVMSPRRAKHPLSWWLMLTGFALSMATTVFVSFLLYAMVQKNIELIQDVVKRNSMGGGQTALTPAGLRPLTTFKPNDPAYVSFKDLQALANGASPAHVMGAQWSNVSPGATWGVEQENGRYVVRVDSLRTSANTADKTEWVSSSASGAEMNYTEMLPVERFKRIKGVKSVHTSLYPSTEQVQILRSDQ